MLKYAELTKAQKRFVDAVVATFPEVAKVGTVSRKELEYIYWELNAKRETGGEKVGFPNWLTGPNKVSRGVFQLPMPEAVEAKSKKTELDEKTRFEKIIEEADTDQYYDDEVASIVEDLSNYN
jgi:hypothetical protein